MQPCYPGKSQNALINWGENAVQVWKISLTCVRAVVVKFLVSLAVCREEIVTRNLDDSAVLGCLKSISFNDTITFSSFYYDRNFESRWAQED